MRIPDGIRSSLRTIARRPVATTILLVVIGFHILAGLFVARVIKFATHSPKISTNYYAKIEAFAGNHPESETAWPLFLDAARADITLGWDQAETHRDFLRLQYSLAPENRDHARINEALSALAPQLRLYREAAARPVLAAYPGPGMDPVYNQILDLPPDPPMDPGSTCLTVGRASLTHLTELQMAATVLAIAGSEAAVSGRYDDAIADIERLSKLAVFGREVPDLIGQLVAIGTDRLAMHLVRELLWEHGDELTNRHLDELSRILDAWNGGKPLRLETEIERWTLLDMAQRVYLDDGNGNGSLTLSGLWNLDGSNTNGTPPAAMTAVLDALLSYYVKDRKQIIQIYDDTVEASLRESERPPAVRDYSKLLDVSGTSKLPDPGLVNLSLSLPAFGNAIEAVRAANTDLEATRFLLAVYVQRLETGSFPANPSEPDQAHPVPIDPFTEKPMLYRVTDSGPLLYSVGADRNDDGGRPAMSADGWVNAGAAKSLESDAPGKYEGDWILFPPHYDEPEDDEE